jgi:RNA polymerase sigma factor (sigma-70 family)
MVAPANYTDISGLIGAASTGGGIPSEKLLPLVYDELRHLAARRVAGFGTAAEPEERLLMIDEALDRLEHHDEASARIVNLKFFSGLTNRQIAELLGVTERTIERQWAYAPSGFTN